MGSRVRHPKGNRRGGQFAPSNRPDDVHVDADYRKMNQTAVKEQMEDIVTSEDGPLVISVAQDQGGRWHEYPTVAWRRLAEQMNGDPVREAEDFYSKILSQSVAKMLTNGDILPESLRTICQKINEITYQSGKNSLYKWDTEHVQLLALTIMSVRELMSVTSNNKKLEHIQQAAKTSRVIYKLPGCSRFTSSNSFLQSMLQYGFPASSGDNQEKFNSSGEVPFRLYERHLSLLDSPMKRFDTNKELTNPEATMRVLISAWIACNNSEVLDFEVWYRQRGPKSYASYGLGLVMGYNTNDRDGEAAGEIFKVFYDMDQSEVTQQLLDEFHTLSVETEEDGYPKLLQHELWANLQNQVGHDHPIFSNRDVQFVMNHTD